MVVLDKPLIAEWSIVRPGGTTEVEERRYESWRLVEEETSVEEGCGEDVLGIKLKFELLREVIPAPNDSGLTVGFSISRVSVSKGRIPSRDWGS